MSTIIDYEKLNSQYLLVKGNQDKYDDIITGIGGKWDSKKNGWVLPIEKKSNLIRLIDAMKKTFKLDKIESNVKSRKTQDKYHRAESESETSQSELFSSSDSESESDSSIKNKKQEKKKVNKSKNNKSDFRNKLSSKKIDNDLLLSSSSESEYSLSSSDDFPSASTPKKRKTSYKRKEIKNELFEKVKELDRRLNEMELYNKKKNIKK